MRLKADKKDAGKKSTLKAIVKNIVTKTVKATASPAKKTAKAATKPVKAASVSKAAAVKAVTKKAPLVVKKSVKVVAKSAAAKSAPDATPKVVANVEAPKAKVKAIVAQSIGRVAAAPKDNKSMNDNAKEIVPIVPVVTGEGEFAVGNAVVYPSHGVGKIIDIEQQEILGLHQEFYVIEFAEDKMILRVPRNRAFKAGLRALCTTETFDHAIAILKEKPKISRGMWSKRAGVRREDQLWTCGEYCGSSA